MEAMFTKMMEGCMKGISEEDQKKMMAFCGEKMATICPCMGTRDLSAEDGKAMGEMMMAFCGSKRMSACFTKTGSPSDQACSPEKA